MGLDAAAAMRASTGQCEFRFYEELNDFLQPARRKRSFSHALFGTPTVKDQIEALGVPHTEVDLVMVDGVSVGFEHRLRGGERVAVYPVFECFDVAGIARLRPQPLRDPRFVLDVHLGRLAAYLRLLGFDCLYRNDYLDSELLAISHAQRRILLTRDIGLLKHGALTHGAFLHSTDPRRQVREVVDRFQLESLAAPFTRCARCNGAVKPLPDGEQEGAARRIPFVPDAAVGRFSRCCGCGQLYWPGSHLARLRQRLAEVGVAL
jgi:uncharacterized protein with PIN domain